MTNTLAYYEHYGRKFFITMGPSLKFAGKAGATLVEPVRNSLPRVGLLDNVKLS